MASFVSTQAKHRKLINRLVSHFHGLDYTLVDKIVTYAEFLSSHDSQEISLATFISEMTYRFNFTNSHIISVIFNKINRSHNSSRTSLTVEQYSRLICTFLTTDEDIKIDFVFNVYDLDCDGFLSKYEVHTMLLTAFPRHSEEQDEMLKDLIEIVMKLVDRDVSGTIDLSEFRDLVRKDISYIELLGQVLPEDSFLQMFKNIVLTKTLAEIKDLIASDRARYLIAIPDSPKEVYYPLKLECA